MGRETLSQTHSGALKGCPGCVELSELRHSVSTIASQVDDAEDRVTSLEATVIEQGRNLAVMAERWTNTSDRIPELLDGLRREFANGLTIAALERRGKDPRESTPAGRLPELKAGPVALRGPVWLVLAVVVVLALVLGGLAAGAYVAAQWGPPSKSAQK